MVGTGPGPVDLICPRARDAIAAAQVVLGYRTYLELISELLRPDQEITGSAMMQEVERCSKALDLASQGRSVALVCGGDPGIYAMAGLVYQLARAEGQPVDIEIIPGIPALSACAALLGAPLMHDFAAISLSDLLTPWEIIERRLKLAAEADFVIAIYNPASKKRREHIKKAATMILEHRSPDTPVGVVTAAYRSGQSIQLVTLDQLASKCLDITMQSTVIVGNSRTFTWNNRMITPRGYEDKYAI